MDSTVLAAYVVASAALTTGAISIYTARHAASRAVQAAREAADRSGRSAQEAARLTAETSLEGTRLVLAAEQARRLWELRYSLYLELLADAYYVDRKAAVDGPEEILFSQVESAFLIKLPDSQSMRQARILALASRSICDAYERLSNADLEYAWFRQSFRVSLDRTMGSHVEVPHVDELSPDEMDGEKMVAREAIHSAYRNLVGLIRAELLSGPDNVPHSDDDI